MLVKDNSDLADMETFILETFPTYVKGEHNLIDTAMEIMINLQGKVEALDAKNKKLKDRNEKLTATNKKLREKAWMYDDLCK